MTNKLSKTSVLEIEKILLKEKKSVLKTCQDKDGMEFDCDGDDVDVIQGKLLSDIQSKISTRDLMKISRIDAALARIATGTFGVCEDCGSDIGKKRLQVKPEAHLCIVCAEREEVERKRFM